METIKITRVPNSWWAGDPRVKKFMPPIREAIARHLPWPSAEFTDIYNRAYEAVYHVIAEYADADKSAKADIESIHSRRRRKHKK
jgi:hypothetical protein